VTLGLLLVTGTAAACASDAATVTVGDAPTLAVEVADSAQERATGLSDRDDVPEGTGMAFVWAEPTRVGFWMQDTLVPLSIVWVRDGDVVDVAEMQPCPTGADCPLYLPSDPDALFDLVVEAPGGTFTEAGVTAGDPVTTSGF
jgi:hypothetical protein